MQINSERTDTNEIEISVTSYKSQVVHIKLTINEARKLVYALTESLNLSRHELQDLRKYNELKRKHLEMARIEFLKDARPWALTPSELESSGSPSATS